jgi:hypothetical protein
VKKEPASEGGLYKGLEGGDEFSAWDDFVAAESGDCGVEAGVDWVVVDWVVGRVVGGEDGAGAGIWVYWGYFDWVDWVGDWGMDFYAAGDWARKYVFIFTGGGYGWGGGAGGGGAFVFWGEELGEGVASVRRLVGSGEKMGRR